MTEPPRYLDLRQQATAYVLRRRPGADDVEVLVILHRDSPESGVQVPAGGALPHETIGEAAVREAREETGVRGVAFGEVLGSRLMRRSGIPGGQQISTYCRLFADEARDRWDHTVSSSDEDRGLRMRCEFRAVDRSRIDWGMDRFLPLAVERFIAAQGPGRGR